jgi:hypothetical protein
MDWLKTFGRNVLNALKGGLICLGAMVVWTMAGLTGNVMLLAAVISSLLVIGGGVWIG